MKHLLPPVDVAEMIRQGKTLLLAGEERLLAGLPEGNWIGGTSANFMTSDGGLDSRDKIFVTDLSAFADKIRIQSYDETTIRRIGAHFPVKGFSFVIMPYGSAFHLSFAHDVLEYTGIENGTLVGWVSGVHPDTIGKATAKVFAGTPAPLNNQAVVMHVSLKAGYTAKMETLNLFKEDENSPALLFNQSGFEIGGDCTVDGEPYNLMTYIKENNIDTKLPLVSTLGHIATNVGIQIIDETAGTISFYAPVFRNVEYHFTKPVIDYIATFNDVMQTRAKKDVIFACNCILNYLYADLKGKTTEGFAGPITFGEIAHHLLNQTMVYLTVEKTEV